MGLAITCGVGVIRHTVSSNQSVLPAIRRPLQAPAVASLAFRTKYRASSSTLVPRDVMSQSGLADLSQARHESSREALSSKRDSLFEIESRDYAPDRHGNRTCVRPIVLIGLPAAHQRELPTQFTWPTFGIGTRPPSSARGWRSRRPPGRASPAGWPYPMRWPGVSLPGPPCPSRYPAEPSARPPAAAPAA